MSLLAAPTPLSTLPREPFARSSAVRGSTLKTARTSNLSSRRVSHQKPVEDLEKKQINASPSEKSAIPTE
jgi:hypothetical protein